MSTPSLQKEFDFFKANQDALVAEHESKYIVIKDEKVIGAYDTELDAYADAKSKFELGSFLIQYCVAGTEGYTQTFHSRVVAH